jgi:EAL domain-containing protein (putative c-di-GMP-specific phosphodiesterase class I)
MINNEESQHFFKEANRIGFTVTIDDFGAGHSSLTYMTYMPISKIKLDKSLCDEYLNSKDKDIMKNLISLCHSFDLITVAEGIESIEAVNYLKEMGCDLVQGYYFSKPMAPENIIKHEFNNY